MIISITKLIVYLFVIIIIIINKNYLAHRTRKKNTLYEPERPQNHDNRQEVGQLKETEIKQGKIWS